MSFLQQRIPNIRSQLVPVDVEFDVFYDRLIHFVMDMITREKLANDQILEIEVKLGAFFSRDENNVRFADTLALLKNVSALNHITLNDYQAYYTFAPCFTFFPWSEMILDSTPYPQPFQHLCWYLQNLYEPRMNSFEKDIVKMYVVPGDDGSLGPPIQHLRLDFNFASGERGSVQLNPNGVITCEIIQKRRLGDQDVMKGQIQFRVTGQVETTLNRNLEALEQKLMMGEPVRQIRFKSSLALKFQFMRIDLSRVLQLRPENVIPQQGRENWRILLMNMLNGLHDIDEWEQNKVPLQFRQQVRVNESKRKSEVEIEIEDLGYVQQYPEHAIKRIVRNVDSFFHIEKVHKDILVKKIEERHPLHTKNDWQAPIIGSYQYTIYQKNHKLRH